MLIVLLAVLGALLASSLETVQYHPQSDEGVYLAYAKHIGAQGIVGFPELFRTYIRDETRWIYPSPLRIGFVAVAVLWTKSFGETLVAMSWLSIASHLALVAGSFAFLRRRIGDVRALFVAALIGFSCLALGLARMALMDSFATLCQAAAVWIFFACVERPALRGRRIAFVLVFTFTILVKEPSVLLVVPFAAFALVEKYGRKHELGVAGFAIALGAPLAIAFGVYVLAAGNLDTLLLTLRTIRSSLKTNTYAINFMSGPWYRYLVDSLLVSAWPTVLAIAFFGVQVVRFRSGEYDRLLAYFTLLLAMQIFELAFLEKDVRYVMLLDLPVRLFALLMIEALVSDAGPWRRYAICGIAVALLCWADWKSYDTLFVQKGTYDPVTPALLNGRGMLPRGPK